MAQLSALSISDDNYVGSIVPDAPASESDEASYVNALALLALEASTQVPGNGPGGLNTITRSDKLWSPLPTVVYPPGEKAEGDDDQAITIDVTGWTYLLAKVGPNALVWYVPGYLTGEVTVPGTFGSGAGLSHVSLYGTTGAVPDGGLSILLLGAAMSALGVADRKLRKA